jgi:hypothetical protein
MIRRGKWRVWRQLKTIETTDAGEAHLTQMLVNTTTDAGKYNHRCAQVTLLKKG